MAEEFEHRSVVHDVLHRIYGAEEAFELRKQGATINRQHNSEHALAAAMYITEIDQADMTPAKSRQSNARALEAATAVAELSAAEFCGCLIPTTTPPRSPRRATTSEYSTIIHEQLRHEVSVRRPAPTGRCSQRHDRAVHYPRR